MTGHAARRAAGLLGRGAGSAGAGALTATALAPFGFALAGPAGLVVLLWVTRHTRGRAARAGLGLVFGAGWFGVGLVWSTRFGVGAYLALVASQAVFHAVALAPTDRRRGSLTWVGGVAGAWVLAETARARLPLGGFAWGQLGHTALDWPLRPAAAVVGALGLSGLLVALAAAAVVAVPRRGSLRARLAPLAATAAVAAILAGVGSLPWTAPAGQLTVALVQVDPVCPGTPRGGLPRPARAPAGCLRRGHPRAARGPRPGAVE